MTTAQPTREMVILRILSDLTAIPPEEILPEHHLTVDLGMDSVASMELIGMLDETFGIEIELEEAMEIETVAAVLELAEKRLG
jgi:acyl carrier protein